MNYDNSISDQVKLSRVLDELILDGSELETIVQFLKQHERDIPDIYKHSAMAYDLYDLGRHPYRVDPFLVKHIDDLRETDFLFALNSLATFSIATENKGLLQELKDRFHGRVDVVKFIRSGWEGVYGEDKFYTCETNLVEWLNKEVGDCQTKVVSTVDAAKFISRSFLALSAFQASTFLNLNPTAQFILLKGFDGAFSDSRALRGSRTPDPSVTYSVYGDILGGLLRQLLVLNQTEIFNWVLDVLEFDGGYCESTVLQATVKASFYKLIPESLSDKVSVSGYLETRNEDRMSFEEIVFEMNLLETTFEPYDLFLAIYLGKDYLLKGMKENKELLEFFSLPFDWDGLKWMKDDYKIEKTRVSPF